MKQDGSIVTCDRCGAQALGPLDYESGCNVYPKGWTCNTWVPGVGYKDICPECYEELIRITKDFWNREGSSHDDSLRGGQ